MKDNALLYGPIEILLPTYLDSIEKGTIFKVAFLTKETCDHSHMNTDQFRHILISTNCKKENKDLRDRVAILTRKLSSEMVNPNSL